MSGTLYVVATPIGNLEDITLRALRVLREAHVIAAEDTRRTARLLSRHGISTPTISFHAHNTRSRIPQIIARLENQDAVALVTDAGTPGLSDPGLELVQACVARGIAVDPIPGPSAAITAAVASGFPLDPLSIYGFAPTRSLARKQWLQRLAGLPHTFTFFEAPHRIRQTLADAAEVFGERPIMLGRELTKVHQELLRGTASVLLRRLGEPRGELTLVVGPITVTQELRFQPISDELLGREFWLLTNNVGLHRKEAIKTLAKKHHRSTREIYAAIERVKLSGK